MRPLLFPGSVILVSLLSVFVWYSNNTDTAANTRPPDVAYSPLPESAPKPKVPTRNWEVLDPEVSAESILVTSLDRPLSYFRLHTAKPWPAASLTKLLTALIVVEDIGPRTKIPITDRAQRTEGTAGGLNSGEEYLAEDLMKIMLLSSSNDAAVAIEDYVSNSPSFSQLIANKTAKLRLLDSVFFDGSGLNDLNITSARDVETVMNYILASQPNILGATRLTELVVQPINRSDIRTITNINSFSKRPEFLGGKTGTSQSARQNLAAVISFHDERLLLIILGSHDRQKDFDTITNWIKKAYSFS